MSCCGQKRAAAAAIARPRLERPSIPPAAAKVSAPPVGNDPRVRYLGPGKLSLRGPISGRVYYFAEAGSTASVDTNDVAALLRTQLFLRDPS